MKPEQKVRRLVCPYCGKPFFIYTMPSDQNTCPVCDGTGKVEVRSSLAEKIRRNR